MRRTTTAAAVPGLGGLQLPKALWTAAAPVGGPVAVGRRLSAAQVHQLMNTPSGPPIRRIASRGYGVCLLSKRNAR